MGAGAAISCFGALNGWVLLSAQVPRAAALDGLLPRGFARLNRRGVPLLGLVVSSAIATGLIAMNYTRGLVEAFTFLILLATLATLMPYVFSSMTAFLLALREGSPTGRRGLYLTLSLVAFGYSLWAIAGAGASTVYWGFILLIVGLPLYVVMRRDKPAEE